MTSVLFGFTGPLDSHLSHQMATALEHRIGGQPHLAASSQATLAVADRLSVHERTRYGLGVGEHGGVRLALAGTLLGDPPPELTQLARRWAQQPDDVLAGLAHLDGAWVLAVLDETRRRLTLARDPAGQRTLCWTRYEQRILFASEIKALRAAPGFAAALRPGGLAQYLAFSFLPAEHTMLEGVFELTAGTALSFDLDRPDAPPVAERFFQPEHEESDEVDAADPTPWVRRTRQGIAQAVAQRLPPSHEPVAVLLSGGLDSSLVAAEVKRQHPGPVKTFSIHFGPKYPSELEYAHAVVDRLGTEHEDVLIRPKDFGPHLPRIVSCLDEPIGDPITAPNFELAGHIARQGYRVLFNGEGGDPLFGGPKNIPMLLAHWYGGLPREPGWRERAYLASYKRSYEILDVALHPAWREQIDPARDLEAVLQPFFEAERPRHLLNKLMAINVRLKGAHLILPKVERLTGAWGLTAMSPLFDARLIRLSFQMPPRLKLRAGVEKWVLKAAYRDELPAAVIDRPKSGMRVPVRFWFRGELRRLTRRVLGPRPVRQAGLLNPRAIRHLRRYRGEEGVITGGRYGIRLWMLLTLELWRREVFETPGAVRTST